LDNNISREASFEIIRKNLRYSGKTKPTIDDVFFYISQNFLMGDSFVECLKFDYGKWIKTKHPLSYFGVGWTSSLLADDVVEPYDYLVSIYRHILLDEPGRFSMIEFGK
jgi:hypothetical protein